jgi:hypothetical protein
MHLELIVETEPNNRDRAMSYFRGYGFDPLPMVVGFLLNDRLERFKTIWPSLTGTESGELTLPAPLASMVRSIHVAKAREPYTDR